jgi:hypothetical protein
MAQRAIRAALKQVLSVHRATWTTGHWTPAFDTAYDWYQRTLNVVDQDPALTALRKLSIAPRKRGNPSKSRNKALRDALAGLNLTNTEINLILRGSGFTRLTGR